ncbi:MAG TPA: carboxypeptidase M32 [Candidatus Bathyarchaeia archaeon]|nr:carboxypeptidase M32 [Candidatus Bathyarchaeia archaeon]
MVKITSKIDLYDQLLEKYKEIVLLNNISLLAYWDLETYIPSKGFEQRSEEVALLSGILHERQTDPEIGQLLVEIKNHKEYPNLSAMEKRNIELIQREYDQQTKVPKDLVTALAKQTALAYETWKKAKEESNFDLLKPHLSKIVDLVKKQASYIDPTKDPYDVLLDINEPGFNREIIDKLFTELRDGLIPIIQACIKSPKQPDVSILKRYCPKSIQSDIAHDVAGVIKYDLQAGRIDPTAHPFTTGFYDDVRVTVHYDENDFTNSFYGMLHEGGHGLYEQNLPVKNKYQPIGYYCSMGIHESQSRFIENLVGRSLEFWEFYLPKLKALGKNIFDDLDLKQLVFALNEVKSSKIRIFADPVTYSLHIIVRYEIEKELFAGKITVADLPNIWNQKMKEYLGVTIENDAEGLLQDSHWPGGAFGYFPDYALGNIYDGQLLWKIEQDLPTWREDMRKGDLSKLINWLINNVHQKGNLLKPLDLIKEITGHDLSPKYYLDYIKKEYAKFYDIDF